MKTVTDKKGATDAAKAYLDYLWSKQAGNWPPIYIRKWGISDKNSDKCHLSDTPSKRCFGTWDEIMATLAMAACSVS